MDDAWSDASSPPASVMGTGGSGGGGGGGWARDAVPLTPCSVAPVAAALAAAAAAAPPGTMPRPVMRAVNVNVVVEGGENVPPPAPPSLPACPPSACDPPSPPLPVGDALPPEDDLTTPDAALTDVVDGVLAEAAVVAASVEQGVGAGTPPPPARDRDAEALHAEIAALRSRLAELGPADLSRFLDLKIELARRAAAAAAAVRGAPGAARAPPAPQPRTRVVDGKPAPSTMRYRPPSSKPVPINERRAWA